MIAYAKQSGRVPYIDTTTNGTLVEPERMGPLIEAGLDKINISVDGMTREQYRHFTKFDFDFDRFVHNIKWLYNNKGNCEIVIKIPTELITEPQQQVFYDTFGDYCDRIFIENFAPCWPQFNVEERTGFNITQGIYQQPIAPTETCPYIFYSMSINADGLVSSCFLDWGRMLIVGEARTQTLVEIWNSEAFNKLRIQHLENKRIQNPVCSQCGQLTHCLPDNIDAYRKELLPKVNAYASIRQLKKTKVLHIIPHLGGGVGKALQTLAADSAYEHTFLILEKPEKIQFLEVITSLGCKVFISSDEAQADALISNTDIVQLEWWNHPATFKFLCERDLPPMRLLVWCHVSGLHTPIIPIGLIKAADRFLFTSSCSFQSPYIHGLDNNTKAKLGVVSSGVGLPNNSKHIRLDNTPMRVGYMGSPNFSKLHPYFINYLAAVTLPDFQVKVWGDEINRELLLEECRKVGKPDLLDIYGYTTDVANVLASLDVFTYLLNPLHYGTAENVLLEAMSAGVVPVVLNNPAETSIVQDGKTGLVVDSIRSFAAAIEWLARHPEKRRDIGKSAAKFVNENFTPVKMIESMTTHYESIMGIEKHKVDFRKILGYEPLEWYLACLDKQQDDDSEFGRFYALDKTKGSIWHYLSYFPDNPKLLSIADSVMAKG